MSSKIKKYLPFFLSILLALLAISLVYGILNPKHQEYSNPTIISEAPIEEIRRNAEEFEDRKKTQGINAIVLALVTTTALMGIAGITWLRYRKRKSDHKNHQKSKRKTKK